MSQQTTTTAGITAGPRYSDNLHLKVFSGEVMTAFANATVMRGRVRVRNISSGSSAQFPAIGKGRAEFHTPGNVILGQQIDNGERVIHVNDLLITSRMISNWEEAINHFNTRTEYTKGMGDELAVEYDRQLIALAAKAADAEAAGVATGFGAASKDNIGASPTLDQLVDAFYDAAAAFDTRNIPQSDRAAIVSPVVYWDFIRDGRFLNRDFGNGGANQNRGGMLNVAGFEIVPSNNFALDFTDADVLLPVKRNGVTITDFSYDNSAGLALLMHPQALGSVSLMGVATESEYQVSRQGTLAVSRMAIGSGVLREEALHLISAKA